MQPSQKHLELLRKYFGHIQFRPPQWSIISSLINDKRDNCVVMATGYGKSLCYQYPPLFCGGMSIVVSPLISLMQDQVLSLKMSNIPAEFLGSSQKSSGVISKILNGEFKIVYITPEYCNSEFGKSILTELKEKCKITLVAIDEAHCISQWGMDFRASYRKLDEFRAMMKGVPFLAVTATATSIICQDICKSLGLINPLVTQMTIDRPNLYLSASIKSPEPESALRDIKEFFFNNKLSLINDPTIIYCQTKNSANKLAYLLNSGGIKCSLYHADLSLSVREKTHKGFVNSSINIIVATIAFGMGIDKPDIKCIIHYGAAKDIETYYQEIGRAGRNGLAAYCHVFYCQKDFIISKRFFSNLVGKYRDYRINSSNAIEKYLQVSSCRRDIILDYFQSNRLAPENKCCDNCRRRLLRPDAPQENFDLSEDALLLLGAVDEIGGRYGWSVIIHLLRGSNNKRLPMKYHQSPMFAKGVYRSENWWKLLGGLLCSEDLVRAEPVFGNSWNKTNFPLMTIRISKKGHNYMTNESVRERIILKPTQEMMPIVKKLLPKQNLNSQWYKTVVEDKTDATSKQPCINEVIKCELTKLRAELATELNCAPYMLFNDAILERLAAIKPTTLDQLSMVEGITEKGQQSFGLACIECISLSVKQFHAKSYENGEINTTGDTASDYFMADDFLSDVSSVDQFFPCSPHSQISENSYYDTVSSFVGDTTIRETRFKGQTVSNKTLEIESLLDHTLKKNESLNSKNADLTAKDDAANVKLSTGGCDGTSRNELDIYFDDDGDQLLASLGESELRQQETRIETLPPRGNTFHGCGTTQDSMKRVIQNNNKRKKELWKKMKL